MKREKMARFYKHIALLLAVSMLLIGCGGGSTTSAPAAATEAPAATAVPAVEGSAGETLSGQHTYVIVPAESKASYVAKEEFFAGALAKYGIDAGLADTIGSTQEIEGQLQLNFDDLTQPLGENQFSVKVNTFVTNRDQRDQWIKDNGPSFNRYPVATFVAKSIEGAPASYKTGDEVNFQLSGDLTIREITKPATFDIKAKVLGNTLTGTATTQLKMSDFGIEPLSFANTLTVADEMGVEVTFTAREE